MKIARTAASVTLGLGLVLGLGACSSGDSDADPTSAPDETTSAPEDDEPDDSDDATDDPGSDSDDQTFADSTSENIGASCEEFNTLMTQLRGIDAADSDAYDDVYFLAQDARDVAPIETYDLFSALSLLALDASLGDESAETADMLRDAVFASAGPCTAEGVTLTI